MRSIEDMKDDILKRPVAYLVILLLGLPVLYYLWTTRFPREERKMPDTPELAEDSSSNKDANGGDGGGEVVETPDEVETPGTEEVEGGAGLEGLFQAWFDWEMEREEW